MHGQVERQVKPAGRLDAGPWSPVWPPQAMESNMKTETSRGGGFWEGSQDSGNDLLMQKGLKVPGTCWKAQGMSVEPRALLSSPNLIPAPGQAGRRGSDPLKCIYLA